MRAGSLGQARRLLAGLGLVRGARGNMAAVRGPGQPALPEGGSLYDDITHTVRTVTSLSLSLLPSLVLRMDDSVRLRSEFNFKVTLCFNILAWSLMVRCVVPSRQSRKVPNKWDIDPLIDSMDSDCNLLYHGIFQCHSFHSYLIVYHGSQASVYFYPLPFFAMSYVMIPGLLWNL